MTQMPEKPAARDGAPGRTAGAAVCPAPLAAPSSPWLGGGEHVRGHPQGQARVCPPQSWCLSLPRCSLQLTTEVVPWEAAHAISKVVLSLQTSPAWAGGSRHVGLGARPSTRLNFPSVTYQLSEPHVTCPAVSMDLPQESPREAPPLPTPNTCASQVLVDGSLPLVGAARCPRGQFGTL